MREIREENLELTRSETREIRSLRKLGMERSEMAMDNWIQETCFISRVASGPEEPSTFNETWNHISPEDKKKCREAITKELQCMEDKNVWKHTLKSEVPTNGRIIGCKWVFKIKRDGTYRARGIALGYSRISGIDFTDNFAPVPNDIFRTALVRLMVEGLDSMLMDVETGLLHGEIEEEINMEVGMNEVFSSTTNEESTCYQLLKGMYGLWQSARQFWQSL